MITVNKFSDCDQGSYFWPFLCTLACATICARVYSYALATTIPLPQADAWRFLDGFLRKYIEGNLTFLDFFVQGKAGDTNQPLQKLILIFHTRFYDMDFSIEGLFGVAGAILLFLTVLVLAVRESPRGFGRAETGLAVGLALSLLSLNSPTLYTWGLASLWFLPILLIVWFMGYAIGRHVNRYGLLASAFLLGILLDEVAFIGFFATLAALFLVVRRLQFGAFRETAIFGGAGLLLAKLFYWGIGIAVGADHSGAMVSPISASLPKLFSAEMWKVASIPLSDSLIHIDNLRHKFGDAAGFVSRIIAVTLLAAHIWFWWRIFRSRNCGEAAPRLTALAIGIQFLFYSLVAGIVLQRVPTFGYDYLHQGRYVLFYQLNLVALGLLVYRQYRFGAKASTWISCSALGVVLLVFAGLQLQLDMRAWVYSKSVSGYVQGVAFTMGDLAKDPARTMECAPILTVCRFPAGKRHELMDLLQSRRYNLFSRRFQLAHRLYPDTESIPR